MKRYESHRAGGDLADDLRITDEQQRDVLRSDETFVAWAYIYQQADLYADDLETTLAGDKMKAAARTSAENARDVAIVRAEELLDRSFDFMEVFDDL